MSWPPVLPPRLYVTPERIVWRGFADSAGVVRAALVDGGWLSRLAMFALALGHGWPYSFLHTENIANIGG